MPQNPVGRDRLRQRKTIWDGDAIETDKYDLHDSPFDSEFLGADEDDADDYIGILTIAWNFHPILSCTC